MPSGQGGAEAMPTQATKLRAVAGSLAIHLLIGFVLYWGLLMQPEVRNAAGQGLAIEATLITAPRSGPVAHARQHAPVLPAPPKPQPPAPAVAAPQPQPNPLQMKSQTQLPKPDTVNQDEIRRDAQLAAERAQKEQEERRRQAQIDLDRKQQQMEAESRQRQQLADEKAKQLAKIRAARAEAERQVKLAAEKLKQDQDMRKMLAQNTAPAVAPVQRAAGRGSDDGGLLGKYLQAIRDTINQNWKRGNAPAGTHCTVHFKQMYGGDVIGNATFDNCPFDAAARASVEDALKKTPMPYAGFEKVFQREVTIDLCFPEEACK